jgi:hypothetical protein
MTRDELSDEQKAEVVRRRELALAHPELLEPWDRHDPARPRAASSAYASLGVTSEFRSRQASPR